MCKIPVTNFAPSNHMFLLHLCIAMHILKTYFIVRVCRQLAISRKNEISLIVVGALSLQEKRRKNAV